MNDDDRTSPLGPAPRRVSRAALVVVLGGLLGACSAPDVLVRGRVSDGPDEKSRPLSGATVDIINARGGPEDSAVTNPNGRFTARAPRGQRIYAVVRADGHVPTAFTGGSGADSVLRVPDGTLFAVSERDLAALLAPFEGCPELDSAGVVLGEVRVNNLQDPDTGENPLVGTASVRWVPVVGPSVQGCYLDDDGIGYQSGATETGLSGQYVIPGVQFGIGELVVSYSLANGEVVTTVRYEAFMPEDGAIIRYPTWVTFETPL